MIKKFFFIVTVFLLSPILFRSVYGVTYDLIAPEGPLHRGEDVQFTIYIDTEGTNVTTSQIGMDYETEYLEYLSTSPGAAMTAVTATAPNAGKFIITGTNTSGFSGNDVYAYVNFKIIATAPGETQLCSLWSPATSPTPTVGPTSPPGTPQPTNPRPTSLPQTGDNKPTAYAGTIGSILMLTAIGLFLIKKIVI